MGITCLQIRRHKGQNLSIVLHQAPCCIFQTPRSETAGPGSQQRISGLSRDISEASRLEARRDPDSTEQCRSGLKSLARGVDAAIPVRGAKPYPVDLLPAENLEKERYVRGYLGMSSTLVFGIEELFPVVDGVVGSYRDHMLVFMRYGSTALAVHRLERVLAAFRSSERSEPLGSRNSVACFKHGENQTLCCAQAGKYLVLSFSSVDSVADDSCRRAMLWLRQHG
jgi:hypothetical protein